jgi:glycosyltransferase involved in cell wall biosynthesis
LAGVFPLSTHQPQEGLLSLIKHFQKVKMKVKIKHPRAKSVLIDGEYWDVDQEFDTTFSKAFRASRHPDVEVVAQYDSVKYNPDLWKKNKEYTFISDVDSSSGWGNVSTNLIKYSVTKHKHAISLVGKTNQVTEPTVLNAVRKEINQASAVVWHEQPRSSMILSPFERNIIILPFETTKIPRSWIARINSCQALFAPCEQNIQAFKDSGVNVPMELIHWGVDPEKFSYMERPERPTFNFGTMGALSQRKGTDILVKAFLEEFPKEQDVRLILKTSNYGNPFAVHDKRVVDKISPCTHEELLSDFFINVDCFVFPTRGEGFGLPSLEAMATGLPVIVTGWSGILEYMRPEYGWMLDYKMVPAKAFTEEIYKEDCGDWAEPSFEQLKASMRYAYEHRDECKTRGIAAARYVQKEWTWDKKIKMYHDALNKHL